LAEGQLFLLSCAKWQPCSDEAKLVLFFFETPFLHENSEKSFKKVKKELRNRKNKN
jgi:hypothetical protein